MPTVHQNRRRPKMRQMLQQLWHALMVGWDLYLFAFGYGIVFVLLGIAAISLSGHSMSTSAMSDGPGWTAPNAVHWFGTSRDGIDMMGPVLHAAGRSIWLALLATVGGSLAGLAVATLFFFVWRERGYRMLDRLAGWGAAIPAIFMVLTLAAGHGAGFGVTLLILSGLCALFVAGRSGRWFHELESSGDVLAARALGYSRRRLLIDHLFTRLWKHAAASATTLLPGVLLAEAALGFTGIGAQVSPAANRIGMLIGEGNETLFDAPWLVFFPGLVLWILCVVLATFAWAVRRTLGEAIDERLF